MAQQPELWSTLLREAVRKERAESKHIVIVGGNNSGKKSLWSRLVSKRTNEWNGSPLNYSFTDLQMDQIDAEDITRLNIWTVKSGEVGEALLPQVLSVKSLPHACVLVVIDLSQPARVMEVLEHWSKVLQRHIAVLEKEDGDLVKRLKEKSAKTFLSYKEPPKDGADTPSTKQKEESSNDDVDMPLPHGVLSTNLGVPIIVVGNKADTMEALERSTGLQDVHWECLQQQIRRFCLQHGAGLIYTSVPTASNCSLLSQYVHCALGVNTTPLTQAPSVLHKDSVFVPVGWDSFDKVSVLLDTATAEQAARVLQSQSIKGGPSVISNLIATTDEAADEQEFLKACKEELEKVAASGGRDHRRVPDKAAVTAAAAAVTAAQPPAEGGDDKSGGPPNEAALVNFFQSLLSRPPNAPGSARPATDPKATQVRTAAEQSLAQLKQAP